MISILLLCSIQLKKDRHDVFIKTDMKINIIGTIYSTEMCILRCI